MAFYDIDLEKIDNAKDDEIGFTVISSEIDQAYRLAPFYQQRMAYSWMQSIYFLLGDQHIWYNPTSRQFETMPTAKSNDWLPRPTTNLIQPAVSTLVSNMTRNKPNADVVPNSPNEKDMSAARIAAKIQDAKWEDDDEQQKNIEAAYWSVTCGTVFRKDYWDTSYSKIVRIPRTEIITEQSMDEMGQIQFTQKEEPVYDEKGIPQFDEIPLGDNAVEIVDPFRMTVDPNASNDNSLSWLMESSIQKLHWIKENYDKEDEGYTGEAKNVKAETDLSTMVALRQRLKTLSTRGAGGFVGSTAGTSGGPEIFVKNAAIVKELYIRPTKKYPRGQLIVSAGGKILYRGDSPDYDGSPDSWHPYTIFRYEIVPGRFWGKGAVEDLVEPQRKINAIDSMLILNRKTMVAPQRLIPHGCGVPEGYWNGAPGLQIQYRPVGANGAKPEVIPGTPLPNQVYQEREVTKNEMSQIARINEVLQGIRPPGVTTASGLQLLLEQSFNSFAPMMHRWEKFIEKGQTKKLKLIAQRYREPRREFIDKLRAVNKDISDVEIVNFIGADLRNNVAVRIEAGSSIPRSHAAKQQQLQELGATGILGDLITDPVNKQEFLERLGVRGFDNTYEADVKRAEWENEMLDNGNFDNIMILPFENHAIHAQIHGNRIKEPSFMSLPPEIQQGYISHAMETMNKLQEQQQQQAMMQAQAQGNLPAKSSPAVDEPMNQQTAEPNEFAEEQPMMQP